MTIDESTSQEPTPAPIYPPSQPATQPVPHPSTLMPGRSMQGAYSAYLLRLWRSGTDGGWRASLQSVHTGERHMFADMESLFAFLCDHARSPP